jgi:hypothetical protein
MPISTAGPRVQRDLRIDFFRGLALLFIFVDHVPENVLGKFTLRNYGFADAAEVFVLLAGFSAVLAYGRVFEAEGFRAGSTRVLKRVRDIYVWHLGVLAIGSLWLMLAAGVFGNPMYVTKLGVQVFGEDPARAVMLASTLIVQPGMMNILPLYIVLLLVWVPFLLWLIPRRPWDALLLSVGVWAIANAFEINLPTQQPGRGWFFNPLAWQLLVTVGALAAYFSRRGAVPLSGAPVWIAAGYLALGFVVVAPWTQIPGLEDARLLPRELLGKMDKTYLCFWRFAHVVALGYLAMTLFSPQSPWLTRSWARGIGLCGRHSLEIFCLGTILSFVGWVVLTEAGNGLVAQILVNAFGIGILLGTSWALGQRYRGTSEVVFASTLRKYLSDWRSQEQRV